MLEISKLNYQYKKAPSKLFDNLDVKFVEGQVNVVIGRNGSGKTTLFDFITNLIPVNRVNKKSIIGIPPEKEILYQLQGLQFPLSLKGKDLFRFFCYCNYSNTIKITNKPYHDDTLSQSEIDLLYKTWNTEFGQLSVGERRYLCILASTLMERKLFVFDEPCSGIDPAARTFILKRIEKLASNPNVLILMSSHNLHDLQNINCKIYMLDNGKFRFQGSYDEFVARAEDNNPDLAFLDNII